MWTWIERLLGEAVRTAVARGISAQLALGVVGPVAIVCISVLYTQNRAIMLLTAVNAGVIAIVVGCTFVGNVGRIRRLAATRNRMRSHDGPFALLLRSFGRTDLYQGTGTFQGPDPGLAPLHLESVVGVLERALRAQGISLVALGGFNLALDRDHGLLWLTCEDRDWTRNIETLISHAGLILVCPDSTAGITTELAMLRVAGHIKRTVFVMAPAIRSGGYISGDDDRERKANAWSEMAENAHAQGFRFPPYDPEGSIFRLGVDLRIDNDIADTARKRLLAAMTTDRREEADALGRALLSLIPVPPSEWPSYTRVREEFSSSRDAHPQPNYLAPPGAGDESAHTFAMSYALALNHHVIVAVLFMILYFS